MKIEDALNYPLLSLGWHIDEDHENRRRHRGERQKA
jgi:hypothetical protein